MEQMRAETSTTGLLTDAGGTADDVWFDTLYPYLHRVACVAAPADIDPDDLVQDALVKFLQLHDPSGVRSPRAFLTRTIVNLASNHRRSWSRHRLAIARLGRLDGAPVEYPSDLDDLEMLPPRERTVLYLHYVDGLPFAEVGALVGCSASTARKAAERGRRRLTHVMEEDNR